MTGELRVGPRVGYVLWTFPGRSETFIASELAAVQQAGVSVQVFAARAEPGIPTTVATSYAPTLPGPGALIGGLGQLRYAARLATDFREFAKSWWLAVRLKKSVAHMSPDLLHSHFANHPTLVTLIIARWLGIPATAMFHANDYLVGVSEIALGRRVAELARACAISQTARDDILRRTRAEPAKVVVVRAAVARELLEREPSATTRPQIVTVARMVAKKGLPQLIDGFAELVRRGDRDTELVLVGDGPERPALAAQIRRLELTGRVRLTGALDHADALDLVWTARAAALTAVVTPGGDADGIPVFLMEAAAAGRPIVSTPVGGVPELLQDGVSGRLLTDLAPAAIADALQAALEPVGLGWGQAARLRLLAEFDPDQQAARLRSIWHQALRGSPDTAGWDG